VPAIERTEYLAVFSSVYAPAIQLRAEAVERQLMRFCNCASASAAQLAILNQNPDLKINEEKGARARSANDPAAVR
jgi:hypothetical protein